MGTVSNWRERARCAEVGPEPFFQGQGGSSRAGKRICATCDVTVECLTFALDSPLINGEAIKGVWGGTTELERRPLRAGRVAS